MKKISLLTAFLVSLIMTLLLSTNTYAQTSYTSNQVAQHNNPKDCWMIINQNVYDLTNYLTDHDSNLDIRSWCGKDATTDYNDKNGRGQSHSSRANSLLNQYLIGILDTGGQIKPTDTLINVKTTNPVGNYNLYLPLLGTIVAYLFTLKVLRRQIHNLIWDSILLLGLIPSFGFGIIMILAKQYPWFYNFSGGNMLYNHVELSIVFGTACVMHFLLRLKIYFSQAKTVSRK